MPDMDDLKNDALTDAYYARKEAEEESDTRGGLSYREWMAVANRECKKISGVGLDDIGDFDSWSMWDSGDTPRAGAIAALEASDFPFDDLERDPYVTDDEPLTIDDEEYDGR